MGPEKMDIRVCACLYLLYMAQPGVYSQPRKKAVVQILQSHMILTMSHWSSGLPVCFLPQGTQVQTPWGDLCETGILLLVFSRYTIIL